MGREVGAVGRSGLCVRNSTYSVSVSGSCCLSAGSSGGVLAVVAMPHCRGSDAMLP